MFPLETLPPSPEIRVGESGLFCLQSKHPVCECFLNFFFYREGLLAPRPTPKLEDHPSSAVRDCLFNLFAATLLIGSRSSTLVTYNLVSFTIWSTFQYAFCIYLYFTLHNIPLIRCRPFIRRLPAISLKVLNSFNVIKLLNMKYIVSVWPDSTLKLLQAAAWLTFLADDIRSTNTSFMHRAMFVFHIQNLFHLFRNGKDVNNSRITFTSKFVLMSGRREMLKSCSRQQGVNTEQEEIRACTNVQIFQEILEPKWAIIHRESVLCAEFIDCTESVKLYVSLWGSGSDGNFAVFGLLLLRCGTVQCFEVCHPRCAFKLWGEFSQKNTTINTAKW